MSSLLTYTGARPVSVYDNNINNINFIGQGRLSIEGETSSIEVTKLVHQDNSYAIKSIKGHYVNTGKLLEKILLSDKTTYIIYQLREILSSRNHEEPSNHQKNILPDQVIINASALNMIVEEYNRSLKLWDGIIYLDQQY